MADFVSELVIGLFLDSQGVQQGMQRAEGIINGGLRKIVNAMAAPLATAFAGLSAANAINAYTTTAVQLDNLSKSLNMSMEDLQGWQYAAEQAGAEAEEVGNFFRDFSDYIVDATTFDSGPLKEIAANLGIGLKDAQGNVKKTTDVVLELADAFQKVDPQKAVAFGMQMSLDPGMIQLLQKGRGEIETLIKAQKELGGYTKEDAEIAHKAQLAFGTLTKAFQAAGMGIARVLVPIMQKAAEVLTRIVTFLRQHSPFVKAVFTGLAAVITGLLVPAFLKLRATLMTLMANPFVLLIGAITAALVGLGLVIDDLYAYMTGGKAALGDFWSIFGSGEEIAQALSGAWEELKAVGIAVFGALSTAVSALWTNFKGVFSAIGQLVKGVLRIIKGLAKLDLSTIWQGLYEAVSGINNIFHEAAQGILNILSGIFSKLADAIVPAVSDALSSAADTVSDAFAGAVQWIVDAFTGAINTVWSFIDGAFQSIGDAIIGVFQGAIEWISGGFSQLVDDIAGWFTGMFNSIPGIDWIKDKLGLGDSEKERAPAQASGQSGAPSKPQAWPPQEQRLHAGGGLRPVSADTGRLASRAQQQKTEIKQTSTVHTGPITVNANPANSQGIADTLGGKLSGYNNWGGFTQSAQTGVIQK